ncbi:alpha/beta hydrolase family protein [Dictyobacter formicarum]|uniref:Peptidase YuxL n=1 Tax=Dictyobacter formicarum TaxID=2778368 RepID=A0ABQ3VFL8_9CHLR|nr:S9 family peptidase [Dictyobacter formicarum]GHO84712.1 putative peptidase YuxL [Dictyobacter formicarum]
MSMLESEDPTTQRPQAVKHDDEPATQLPSQTSQHADAAASPTPPDQQEPAKQQAEPAPIEPSTEPAEQQAQASPTATSAESADTPSEPVEPASQPEPAFPGTSANTIQVPIEQTPSQTTQSAPLPAAIPVVPPMDVEDLLSLKIASDPQISPDGSLIAYTILESDAGANTTRSTIWLAEIAGGKAVVPRKLSSGTYHDITPRWAPDGQSLAFLSDRSGIPQIYLLTLNGGEAQQVSDLDQGITEYSWHPNGQILLAHSAWKPQDDQPEASSENFLHIYTRLGSRWDGKGYSNGRHQQLWLIPLSGNPMRITSEPVDLVQSCWSPDGQEVVFCANRRADPDLSVSMALWVLTLSNGHMRRLTPEEGLAQMPSWSPDGHQIAYLYTPDQTEAGNIMPWIVDARGETPRLAVPGADAFTCQSWIIDELRNEYLTPPQWYPDSQALLVPVQEHGQLHLYRLNLNQQTSERLTNGNGRYISPQLSKNGRTIAMVRADWFTPGDIWCMDSTGKQPRKLTRVNDAILQSHRLTRPKRITWRSFDGLEIEGWLYLPQLPENVKAPLIVCPHGGPSLAWGDSYVHEFQVLAGRGYAVLAPNIRGSAGYGEDFARRVLNDWGGDDFKDLMAGVDHVIATEPINGERLGIGGLSYGGYMTNWSISQTTRFKAAVSRNGISYIPSAALLSDQTIWFNLSMETWARQHERSALTHAEAIQTPLLLLHAEDDQRCPFSESNQLFVALRKRKQPVELIGYRDTSHLMDWPGIGTPQQRIDRLRRTIQWYERFI